MADTETVVRRNRPGTKAEVTCVICQNGSVNNKDKMPGTQLISLRLLRYGNIVAVMRGDKGR